MRIALDYDQTFTLDKGAWVQMIDDFQYRGHEVLIVTYRREEDVDEDMEQLYVWKNVKTIFTGQKAKKAYCESIGLKIDVWIDDNPETILKDSDWTEEQYQEWRATLKNG